MNFVQQIRQFSNRNPRLVAGLFFLGGLLATWIIYDACANGKRVSSRAFAIAAMGWTLGLGGLIEPRLLNAWNPEADPPVELRFKVIGGVLAAVGIVASLWVRANFFTMAGASGGGSGQPSLADIVKQQEQDEKQGR
jgi:hypothetical protein